MMADSGLVLSGYQKKLKTMKKKFFVLYKETTNTAARLEYYDSEKKFMQRAEPKRVIYLKSCFNINRRLDTKHKFVLALSSKEGGFGIVLNSESDLRKWLDNLLTIQRDNANGSDQYEYVWQVVVQKKGISESAGMTGSYHCCLTSKSLTFICIGPDKLPNGDERIVKVEILLTTIRRCGHASPQSIFYMELGRQSLLGSGELWMETEDAAIAKNMHDRILSAMSAKTETNMNLLNVYKGKLELNNEPMRKRSSSATEASKPINVLQKRQHSIEIRNSFSPQYNSYGRERCDSLPTRNRTLSECSNQAYIALKHGQRCNTISGTRYTTEKHNDSPPINTPMKCSESEESSISIDEADDKSIYDAYRINSRTSKTVIPEENADDLIVSDNSKFSRNNENFENYISMTPIKSIYENMNDNQLKTSVGSTTLQSVADEDFNFDFPEHASEKLGNEADVENQCERPSRAYSIGSKVEHTKMRKIPGNLNEVDISSPRVRAYSVGSKSKIPRCDIQRGVIFSRIKKGSHFNVSMDVQIGMDVMGIGTPKEIKSTSAPLLSLKNYMNTGRMSDLMEIDFSNVSSASASQEQNMLNNYQVLKSMQSSTTTPTRKHNVSPKSFSNGNIKLTEMLKEDESSNRNLTNHMENSDSGYLEMKPVGRVHQSSKQISLEDHMEKLKLQSSACLRSQISQNEPTNDSQFCNERAPSVPTVNSIRTFLTNPNVDCTPETIIDKPSKTNISNPNVHNNADKPNTLNPKWDEHTKLDNNKTESSILNNALDVISAATVGRKLIHSVSNEDYTKPTTKLNDAADSKDVGYQILQIKSDSSLISKKINQRPIYKPQCSRQIENVNNFDKSPKANTTATTGYLPLKITESKTISEDALSVNVLNKDNNVATATSGLCGHELVYASLDLPQCSGHNTNKCLKKALCESPPITVCIENTSSYAKIDFDQSDSSSASSKVCNA